MEDPPERAQQAVRARFYDLIRERQTTIARARALGDEWLTRAVEALDDAKAIRGATDPPPTPHMLALAGRFEHLAAEAERKERRALQLADEIRDSTSAFAERATLAARERDILQELIAIVEFEEAAGRDPMAHPTAARLQAALDLLTHSKDSPPS